MTHLSRSACIGLVTGGLALGSGAAGFVINDAYVTGPKHDTHFTTAGTPLSAQYTGDMKFKDYVVDVGADRPMRFSTWQPNRDLEPAGFERYSANETELTHAFVYNKEQRRGRRESLMICDIFGYGRVGYVDGLHRWLVDDVISRIAPGEYAQQIRLNVTDVTCEKHVILPTDPIWALPSWNDGAAALIAPEGDYGLFRVIRQGVVAG